MPLVDPYDSLEIPRDIVAEFLGLFARCEYAMKESSYKQDDGKGRAIAAWDRLASDAPSWLDAASDPAVAKAIEFLTLEPPKVQLFHAGFQSKPLAGNTELGRAIQAARRVRNNLFHGGKHPPEPSPGRNEALVRAAIIVIAAVIENCPGDLRDAYNYG